MPDVSFGFRRCFCFTDDTTITIRNREDASWIYSWISCQRGAFYRVLYDSAVGIHPLQIEIDPSRERDLDVGGEMDKRFTVACAKKSYAPYLVCYIRGRHVLRRGRCPLSVSDLTDAFVVDLMTTTKNVLDARAPPVHPAL